MQILTDREVSLMPPGVAVAAVREAIVEHARGALTAPPRVRALDQVFTAGALRDGSSGFRAYRATAGTEQLCAVWDPSGRLSVIVTGDELGLRRTGAIGAVAADTLARPDATRVTVIGTGPQAWSQLRSLTAVRPIKTVTVYGRNPAHTHHFAARAHSELGLRATTAPPAARGEEGPAPRGVGDPASGRVEGPAARRVEGPAARGVGSSASRPARGPENGGGFSPDVVRDAVRGADIVIVATRSARPVLDPADVSPGTHVTSVGPKTIGGHELPLELAERAAVLVCDSPAQAAAYAEPFFVEPSRLVLLGDVLIGRAPGRRTADDITVFCSVGLAGTEVALARRLAAPPA